MPKDCVTEICYCDGPGLFWYGVDLKTNQYFYSVQHIHVLKICMYEEWTTVLCKAHISL